MKIWENDYEDVWVEQNGQDLLFYGQGQDQDGRDLVVVTMEELVEIVQNTEQPEDTVTKLNLSKQNRQTEENN